MGKHEKLLARLTSRPKDFTFQEMTTLLAGFGYTLDPSGSGSRVKFEHRQYASIYMHKPHPAPVLKPYQIDVVIDTLRQEGLL